MKAEDAKTKLSCEFAFKQSESGSCENDAFVRDFPQKVRKLKMRKRSFRASFPSKSESGRCENEAFVRDFDPSKSES